MKNYDNTTNTYDNNNNTNTYTYNTIINNS